MTATFRDASDPVFLTSPGVQFTVTTPGTVQDGDLGVLVAAWVDGPDPITVSGWTELVAPTVVGSWTFAVLARTYVSGDSADITGTLDQAGRFLTAQAVWYSQAEMPTAGTIGTRPGTGDTIYTTTAPGVTTDQFEQLTLAIGCERTTSGPTTVSVSPGTKRAFSGESGDATCTIAFADYVQSTTGTSPDIDLTYSDPHDTNGAALQLAVPSTVTPTPSLARPPVQGLPGTDTVRATALTSDTSTVRMAVSTSSDMSSPVFGPSATPDGEGYASVAVTGLTADTQYWWQLELNDTLVGTPTATRTLPPAGAASSFAFAAASCAYTGSEDPVFTAIRDRCVNSGALWFSHLGDLHYTWSSSSGDPTAPADESAITTAYEDALSSSTQAELYRDVPMVHVWSDNDFCGSNSDSTAAAVDQVQETWRKTMSYPPLQDSAGIYRAWTVGRVRIIVTDGRSFMDDKDAPDDASKSLLGATQKQWLKDQLVRTEPLKIWLHESKWTGTPVTGNDIDYWVAYSTERQEIADFIEANNVDVYYVHGDTHALAADDGTNNPYGGFPFVGCAPMDQGAYAFPHAASEGSWPVEGSAEDNTVQHSYGWISVTDSGSSITVDYTGYTADGTARITMTTTHATQQPSVFEGWGLPL